MSYLLHSIISLQNPSRRQNPTERTVNTSESTIMAFEHPTFALQFDHQSSQDQNTCYSSSYDKKTNKTTRQELDEDYSLNTDEIFDEKSSKLAYSPPSSQTTINAASRTGSNNVDICNARNDTMDPMAGTHVSEITKYADYSEMLQDLGQCSKMLLLQYSQVFGDSETYEQQVCQAITDLTAHAQLLLQNFTDQKKMLCSRIISISDALRSEC